MRRVCRPVVAGLSSLLFVAGCVSARADYTEPAVLAALIDAKTEPYFLVDVRTAEEYTSGHIPSAANVPVDTIRGAPPTEDKAALIIVYCRSGARSAAAKAALEELGYIRVVNFGAVSRWTGTLVIGPDAVAPD